VIAALFETLVRLYYPVRVVEHADRIPAAGPVILVLNHPNGLLDPIVVRVATGRRVRFLAKSTLFDNPLGLAAMRAFGTIPVYRAHESGERAGDASRNEESFALCRAELARGGAIALFPEGASHSDPALRALKTGAARIALSAEAESHLGLTVVPVGLHFDDKVTFRSSVLLVAGEPIAVAPLLADYARDERTAVNDLTQLIRTKLDEVVLQAESRELLQGVALVAVWTAADGNALDPVARNRRARRLADAYQRMSASDPARVDAIARAARDYARMLRRMGVRDPWSLVLEPVRLTTFLWALVRLIVLLPFADIGALLGWVPYRLSGLVAERNAESDDVLGTVKLLSGMLFLGGAWIIESIVIGVLFGAVWIVPFFAMAAVTGYVALRYGELADGAEEWARALWLRAFHRDSIGRLTARRRQLAGEVAKALGDVS
jgi:1-acyl-sn-glycerol-3-phosphate acyltransferase